MFFFAPSLTDNKGEGQGRDSLEVFDQDEDLTGEVSHFLFEYVMKVGLVDLSTHGGKIKFEFCCPALRCLDIQNSNLIFPPWYQVREGCVL